MRDLVEFRVGTTCEETVQLRDGQYQLLFRSETRAYLDQQEEVRILTLGGCSLGLFDVVSLEIDTLSIKTDKTMLAGRVGR